MNRAQAMVQMARGEKITHIYFEPHEWATNSEPDKVVHEDGAEMPLSSFWELRKDKIWDNGWGIFPNIH